MTTKTETAGFCCAYTPLPLIYGAGLRPFRVLPSGDSPDRAGLVLHDNLCPHVKRVLDRALAGDVPELSGMIFMNSCDSMRRLYDAWKRVRPGDRTVLVDLPAVMTPLSLRFFAGEIAKLAGTLSSWTGKEISDNDISKGVETNNRISRLVGKAREHALNGSLRGGFRRMQELYNTVAMSPPEESIALLEETVRVECTAVPDGKAVPVYLFGNVLTEEDAFELFESCGARIVGEDLCTGSRLFSEIPAGGVDVINDIAGSLMTRTPCARTFDGERPGSFGDVISESARGSGARGVIGYTAKFCDPYIARMPAARESFRRNDLPFLLLEGDCTMRSIGQQRTRIEAFIEMLR